MRFLEEIAEAGKVAKPRRSSALLHDHQDLARPLGGVFHLVFQPVDVYGHDFSLFSAFFGGADPAHGIDAQAAMNGRCHFGLSRAARPATRDLPLLRVHILQAHGAHFLHAPLNGLSGLRRSGHAPTDVVGELFQVVIGFRAHHSLPGNGG